MEKYVELIKNTRDYLKGTQFKVTHEDEGMWSLYAFYSGEIDGAHFSCEQKYAKSISDKEYCGRIVRAPQKKWDRDQAKSYGDYYDNFP